MRVQVLPLEIQAGSNVIYRLTGTMKMSIDTFMSTNPKKRRSPIKTRAVSTRSHPVSGSRMKVPWGPETDTICAAICTRVIRGLQEEASTHLEILNDPRLLRLVVSRARATGDIQGAFEDSIKALRKLRMIEERRR
jgi:hypothetical protein